MNKWFLTQTESMGENMKLKQKIAASAALLFAALPVLTSAAPMAQAEAPAVYFNEMDTSVNGGEPIRGVDISSVLAIEEAGVVFYNEYGNRQDIFRTLSEYGVNYIRVRVWNAPCDSAGNSYGGGNCDVETAAEIGRRAAQYGMKLLVDFHYSDFWSDPGKQTVPKAWQSYTHEQKQQAIYQFTADSLRKISDAGADIGMVQVGNETNCFFCGETDMYKICELFASGCRAVREFDRDVLIALHFANPASGYYDWYAQVLNECNVDYDVFATSYYPYWHGTTENLTNVLRTIGNTYNKYVMVAETAYPYTSEDGDTFGNAVSESSTDAEFRYDISVDGQAQCLSDVFQAVANVGQKGIGAFYWEPAWLGVPDLSWEEQHALWEQYGSGWATAYAGEFDESATAAGGSSYDNQALFDFDGRPLDSLSVFRQVYPQNEVSHDPIGAQLPEGSYRIRNVNSGLYLTVADGEEAAGSNVVQYEADGAAPYNTWHLRSSGDGYYRMYSDLGDGNTYLLDLDYGKADNQTNIGIYTNTDSAAQEFMLIENDDGSYYIVTKVTGGKSAIELVNAETQNGANVQQFEINGHDCQKWILEPVEDYYCTGDLDGNDRIDAFDLAYMKKLLLDARHHMAADLNRDEAVSMVDMLALQRYLFGEPSFQPHRGGTPHNTIFPHVNKSQRPQNQEEQ